MKKFWGLIKKTMGQSVAESLAVCHSLLLNSKSVYWGQHIQHFHLQPGRWAKCTLSIFADNRKQGGVLHKSNGCSKFQASINGKVKWVMTLRVRSAKTSAWGRMTPSNVWCSSPESKSTEGPAGPQVEHWSAVCP